MSTKFVMEAVTTFLCQSGREKNRLVGSFAKSQLFKVSFVSFYTLAICEILRSEKIYLGSSLAKYHH